MLGVTSLVAITVLATIIAIIVSETTSNTASAAIVVPIVIPIAVAAGVNPLIPALAATFGASCGFMLPVSTPPNAIVYGSGLIPITKMVRSGHGAGRRARLTRGLPLARTAARRSRG